MSLARPSLREVLAGLGVPTDDASIARAIEGEDDAPWFVRVLVGFGGWVASLCFLGFIVVARMLDSKGNAVAIGLLMVVSTAVLRFRARGPFSSQLALAGSLAGQGLVVFGLSDLIRSTPTAAALSFVFEVALVVGHVDRVHRFLSTIFAVIALAVWMRAGEVPAAWEICLSALAFVVFAAFWREPELASGRFGDAHEPVATGLSAALLGMALVSPFERLSHSVMDGESTFRVAAVIVPVAAGCLLLATLAIVRGTSPDPRAIGAALSITAVSAITYRVPGIALAAMVAALGVHRRRPAVVALAAAFLAVFLSYFYYELRMTLLAKSGVLIASGMLVLASRFLVPRKGAA